MAEETMKDVGELQRLAGLAERPQVKKFLETEVQRLLATVPAKANNGGSHDGAVAAAAATQSTAAATATVGTTTKTRDAKAFAAPIKSYGWDQTSSAVKIYVTLDGVGTIPEEQVQVKFSRESFSLLVENLNGKNHTLSVTLGDSINVDKSSFKIRRNNVQLSLSKSSSGNWSHLTAKEKKEDEKKKSQYSEKPAASAAASAAPEDPQAGIMNLLKKMYDDGDDDMKRNLSKAWMESQDKQSRGEFGAP